jgi:phosphatidylserine decarboxylase
MLAKGSQSWILLSLALTLLSIFLFLPLAVFYFLVTIFFVIFFRDPERTVNEGIVACADGKITKIENKDGQVRIVTVMNLQNVHVNRAPYEGKVVDMEHINGKHIPAFSKDSDRNERFKTTLETKIGEIKIVQIAGAFARRIEPYIHQGENLKKGQRIGMIRFGSRVDLYLPADTVKIMVKEGDMVKAAESQIAKEIHNEN